MEKEIRKACDTCRFWIPIGGCGYGGCMPCNKWKLSLSLRRDSNPTLFDQED